MEQQTTTEASFKLPAYKLIDICKLIKEFKTEVRFKFNNDGLFISEIDIPNISLMNISLLKEHFSIYNLSEEVFFCLNIDSFYKTIKEQKKTDLSLCLNTEKTKLLIKSDSGFNSELTLLEVEAIKNIPSLDFNTSIKINTKTFKEAIKNLSNIGDTISFILEDNTFKMRAKTPLNEGFIDFNKDSYSILNESYPAKSNYSSEYLLKLCKNITIFNDVVIKFNNQYPLNVIMEAGSFEVSFILAPKISGEDE